MGGDGKQMWRKEEKVSGGYNSFHKEIAVILLKLVYHF